MFNDPQAFDSEGNEVKIGDTVMWGDDKCLIISIYETGGGTVTLLLQDESGEILGSPIDWEVDRVST